MTLIIFRSNNFLIDHVGLLQNPDLGGLKGSIVKHAGAAGPTRPITTTAFCLCCTSRKVAGDDTYMNEPGRVPTKFYCQ